MKDAREALGAGLIRDHRLTQIEASRSMWSSQLVTWTGSFLPSTSWGPNLTIHPASLFLTSA
jgi:hypothetical protein